MAETLTRYLKLKVADDLSADAKYNLQRIDSLGATTITSVQDDLLLRSRGDVIIEPESADIGGLGNSSGTLQIGTPNNKAEVSGYTSSFSIRSALSLLTAASDANKVSLAVDSAQVGAYTISLLTTGNAALTVPPGTDEIVTKTATQTLSNKSLSGTDNTFSNISYPSLLLTGSIINADIKDDAAIADTKLATISTSGKVANSATTATSLNLADRIVSRDGAGNFAAGTITANLLGTATNITATSNSTLTTLPALSLPGSQVTGDISGKAANITGIVAVANGGTGNDGSNKATALLGLLPPITGSGLSVLRVNITENGIEWASGAGAGTVTSVSASAPLAVSGDQTVNPTLSISAASSLSDGYLSSTDWSTFNAKEGAISAGTTLQYWRGDKSWQTLDKSAVGLSNVDNTSDANKPISTATATALSGKEPTITAGTTGQYWRGDKSWQTLNTAAVTESISALYFTDSRAKTAAVVDSTAGSQTDQAPSVSAIKAYITATGGGATAYTWATADGTTKSITHSLNKTTVAVTIYDENGEDILVDTIDRTSSNAVSLTSSVAPTGNWTVVIRP